MPRTTGSRQDKHSSSIGRLTDRDHANMTRFLREVYDKVAAGKLERVEMVEAIAHIIAAVDIGNHGEASAWFARAAEPRTLPPTKPAKPARLFTTGGSQAVRLPAEFRFPDQDVVFVHRNAAGEVVLSGKIPPPYASFMAARDAAAAELGDFLSLAERKQGNSARDPFAGASD